MGQYASTSDLRNVFGTANIRQWSNLDNTTTSDDTTRIDEAIAQAEAKIHDLFRDGPYQLPFTFGSAASAKRVTYWVAVLAGLWLFEPRKIAATGDKEKGSRTNQLRDEVLSEIRDVLAGGRRLDATLSHTTATGPTPI